MKKEFQKFIQLLGCRSSYSGVDRVMYIHDRGKVKPTIVIRLLKDKYVQAGLQETGFKLVPQ